jgi:predicted transcriptional regulator
VSHRVAGRQFLYQAEVTEPMVRQSMVGELTDMLFAGRPSALVSHLITERDIDATELDEMKRLITQAEQRVAPNGR